PGEHLLLGRRWAVSPRTGALVMPRWWTCSLALLVAVGCHDDDPAARAGLVFADEPGVLDVVGPDGALLARCAAATAGGEVSVTCDAGGGSLRATYGAAGVELAARGDGLAVQRAAAALDAATAEPDVRE